MAQEGGESSASHDMLAHAGESRIVGSAHPFGLPWKSFLYFSRFDRGTIIEGRIGIIGRFSRQHGQLTADGEASHSLQNAWK